MVGWGWVAALAVLLSACLLTHAQSTETYTFYVSASEKEPSSNCTAQNPCRSLGDAVGAFGWRSDAEAIFQVYLSPGWYNGADNVNITLPQFSRLERNNQTLTSDDVVFEGDFLQTDFGFSVLSEVYLSQVKMIGFYQAVKARNPPSLVVMNEVEVHDSVQSVYTEGGTLIMTNCACTSGTVILNSSGSSTVMIINSTFSLIRDAIQIGTGSSPTNITIEGSQFDDIEEMQVNLKNSTLHITNSVISSSVRSLLTEEVSAGLSINGGHVFFDNVIMNAPNSEIFSDGLVHNKGLSFKANNLTMNGFNITMSVTANTVEMYDSVLNAGAVCAVVASPSITIAGTTFLRSQSTALVIRPIAEAIVFSLENSVFNSTGSVFYRYQKGATSITGTVNYCDFYEVRGSALDLTQGNWTISNVQVHSIMKGNNLSPGISYRASTDSPGRIFNVSSSSVYASVSRVSGAGISAYGFQSMYLTNSTFLHNNGSHGGAVHANGDYVEISNSYFANNRDTSEGGAVYLSAPSFLISNCVFENNTSLRGGDVSVWTFYASDMTIRNCTFSSSYSSSIYFHGDNSTLELDALTFGQVSPYTVDCAPQTTLTLVMTTQQAMTVDGVVAVDSTQAMLGSLCTVQGMQQSQSTSHEENSALTPSDSSGLIAFLSVIAVLSILLLLACMVIVWIRRDRNQHMDELMGHDEFIESFDTMPPG